MLRYFFWLFLLLPGVAQAAERRVFVGSFDRLRVQGSYEIMVATGGSPGGTVTGDSAAIDNVEVRIDGTTLVVRPAPATYDNRPHASGEPTRILLSTPSLSAISVTGAARVTAGRMKGERVDLALSGTGVIEVADIQAPRVEAAVLGSGRLALAGKAESVRLISSGSGTIDAGKLDAGQLFVRLDGTGEIGASARYAAQVNNIGLGSVSVAGRPKCQVVARAGGPVTCGVSAP